MNSAQVIEGQPADESNPGEFREDKQMIDLFLDV